jgi:hypothetical protein
VTIAANPKQEHGEASVDGSGVESIVFSETFIAIEKIKLTPSASAARIATYDNLTLSGFDLCLFDSSGSAVSGNVKWEVEGY